jgi:hypothetical protein
VGIVRVYASRLGTGPGLALTVLAADGGKVKDVELAALGNAAGAKSRVDLGQSDRSACGEGEDGGGELHVECNLWVG